jgi:MoaA/NifB/PqqE/SkfB family radical SAM enzyme
VFENTERSDDTSDPEIEIDLNLPPDLNFNLDLLYGFLQKDPAPALTFYGGEPLLRADLIERIVCEAPVQRFMMQTNGVLLDRLHRILSTVFYDHGFS